MNFSLRFKESSKKKLSLPNSLQKKELSNKATTHISFTIKISQSQAKENFQWVRSLKWDLKGFQSHLIKRVIKSRRLQRSVCFQTGQVTELLLLVRKFWRLEMMRKAHNLVHENRNFSGTGTILTILRVLKTYPSTQPIKRWVCFRRRMRRGGRLCHSVVRIGLCLSSKWEIIQNQTLPLWWHKRPL